MGFGLGCVPDGHEMLRQGMIMYNARTWAQLFDRTDTCVRLKESELSQSSSTPRALFGKDVKDLAPP